MLVFKMKATDRIIKNALKCITFIFILIFVNTKVSYVLRAIGNTTSREYLSQPTDTIDVLYVGPSSVYSYWNPMEAYRQTGIISYNYSSGALPQQLTKYVVTDALKYQSPYLLLIDLRMFVILEEPDYNEADIRTITDSFYYSLDRFNAINSAIPKEADRIAYHFDIIKYHTNTDNFIKKENWYYAFNIKKKNAIVFGGFRYDPAKPNIGCYWPDYSNLGVGQLSASMKSIYDELIGYVKNLDINVIFIFSPYIATEEQKERINYMKSIAKENNITTLDVFDFLDEIGLDTEIDFRDTDHTNIFGAEKYTKWLSSWLKEHYDLPDRRGDSNYANWDAEYESWIEKSTETKQSLMELIPEELRIKAQENMQ